MIVERCTEADLDAWIDLRQALWPRETPEILRGEAQAILASNGDAMALIVRDEDGAAIAFAEGALRRDYVNGCDTSPVGFLEGIYVRPDARRTGIARTLCQMLEDWAAGLGCSEFASDVLLDNSVSQQAHAALGFEETERVVFYRKALARR